MTIGIGVLATGGAVKPDTLILASDTFGSLDDSSSTQRLHKMFLFPEDELYIVASGNINKASELVPRIQSYLRQMPIRNTDSAFHAIHQGVADYHRWRIGHEVLPKYKMIPGDSEDPEVKDLIRDECMMFDIGCNLIVGAFADNGQALLFETYSVGNTDQGDSPPTLEFVRSCSIPGFAATGSGEENAHFWLNYRNHTLSYMPRRAVYHAYEAKRMAENSPHVNEKIELLIATKGIHSWLHDKRPVDGDWSLQELKNKFEKYGPRSTDVLDGLSQ